MKEIFLSDKVAADRMPFTEHVSTLGQTHYSWQIISRFYQSAIQQAGYRIRNILRPEIYQSEIARKLIGQTDNSIHIAVKPVEHLRPMLGAKNIFVCGWEFPEFSADSGSLSPFYNQTRILRSADSVICWTDYTRDNLTAIGISRARTLPPPIATPMLGRGTRFLDSVSTSLADHLTKKPTARTLGSELNKLKPRKLFVSVLNPFDRRKQISTMLTGFQAALIKDPLLVLVVKLVIDNVHTTVGNINEILAIHYDYHSSCERILFLGDQYSAEDLSGLISSADFYLCSSSAEGLNIPLIEAQMLGIPAVSTWNTAMGTYLDRDCSIPIASSRQPFDGKSHAMADVLQVTHFPPKAGDVAAAIIQAASMDDGQYDRLSSSGKSNAERRFGQELFQSRLEKLLSELSLKSQR